MFSDGNGVGHLGVKVGWFKAGLFGLGRTPLSQMAWPLKLAKFNSQCATTNSIPHNNNLPQEISAKQFVY